MMLSASVVYAVGWQFSRYIGKYWEGNSRDLIATLFENLTEGGEENHNNSWST
jgi:hypothetical protein